MFSLIYLVEPLPLCPPLLKRRGGVLEEGDLPLQTTPLFFWLIHAFLLVSQSPHTSITMPTPMRR